MRRWSKALRAAVLAGSLTILLLAGCDGTDTRRQADDTVEELAGKKQVERMNMMKKDLERIQNEQARRIDQLEEAR